MGSRDENAHAISYGQNAALDNVGDDTVQDIAVRFRLNDLIPALQGINALLGEHNRALLIVGAHDEQFQLIAHFDQFLGVDVRISGQLVHRNITRLLAADHFHLHFVGGDAHDNAAYSFICT